MSDFIKGSIFITFSNYLFFIVSFIFSIFIVRILPVFEYGVVGYYATVYTILFPLYHLSLHSAITHFISKYPDENWKVLTNSIKIFLLWSPLITITSFFLFLFFQNIIFILLMIIFLVNSIIQFILGYFRGVLKFKFYSIILILNNFVTLFAFVFILISNTAIFYYIGYVCAIVLICLISVYLLRKNKPDTQKTSNIKETDKTISKRELLAYAIPLLLLSFVSFFGAQFDKLLIFHTEGEIIAGNYYFLIFYTSILGSLFLSINDALFPVISGKFYKENTEEINVYYQNILKFSLLIYFFIMTYLVLLSAPIINFFFGTKYLAYIYLLGILFFSSIFSVFGYCTTTMYLSHNIVKKMAFYLVVINIFSILIKTLLIITYGIIGACISLLIINLISQIILIKVLLRYTNLIFPKTDVLKVGSIGIVNFLIFYSIIFTLSPVFWILSLYLIGSIIFLVLLIRFSRVFHPADFEIIRIILQNLKFSKQLTLKIIRFLKILFLTSSMKIQNQVIE